MWNPKENMSLTAYWTAFDGVNLSGNNVISLTDLSGNGNDLTAINNPQIVPNGINGVQSIRFNGTNRLERLLPINGITDLNNRSGWIVFKIEDVNGVGYHNIFLLGGASYTSAGSNFMQLYNTNNSPVFYQNYTTNTLDASINLPQTQAHYCVFNKSNGAIVNFDGSVTNTVGVQTINNNGLFVGQWNSKGAKMLFCEMAILNNEISESDKVNLENYFAIKYGIKKNIEVINSGVNGNNTQDIINRLPLKLTPSKAVQYRGETSTLSKTAGQTERVSGSFTLPVGADFKTYGAQITITSREAIVIENRYICVIEQTNIE